MQYLQNFVWILLLFPSVWIKIKRQRNFLNKFLHQFSIALDKSDFERLNLYGLYVPVFVGESYCMLRGSSLTNEERTAVTCIGASTGLFDDLFDKKSYDVNYIKNLLLNPEVRNGQSAPENTLVQLYVQFLESSPHPNQIKELALKVFDAQVNSKRQFDKWLDENELKLLTFEKGGFTMQLYRRAFGGEISENEDLLFYKIGAIGQLENDIFDVYKDYKEGINTLATTTTDIAQLRETYHNLHREILTCIDKTEFKLSNKNKFKLICAFIFARGYLAINQLELVSKRTNNIFKVSEYSRSELVTDMEKPINRIKLLHYAASCAKK